METKRTKKPSAVEPGPAAAGAAVRSALADKAEGSLVQKAIRMVREYIRENSLRVGDPLPGEMHFSAALGVSRPVVREAFGVLAALKLIDVGNGRRPRVGALDGSILAASLSHAVDTAQISIAEIWDARRTIEKRAAALAAVLRTESEARDILTIARSMVAVQDDHEELSRRDVAFHRAVVAASHNGLFVQFLESFGPMMEASVPTAWRTRVTKQDRHRALEHHLAIATAIVTKDADAAEAAVEEHFEKSVSVIFDLMLQSEPA